MTHFNKRPKNIMRGGKYIAVFILVALAVSASRPLLCWKIDRNLQWKRAPCYSDEFNALMPWEQPAPVQPTATPEPWTPQPTDIPEPTATPTWTWKPTATVEPYPAPTYEPYPALEVWGGIETIKGWWK